MPEKDRRIRLLVALLLLVLVLAPVLSSGVDLLVDWLWFRQESFGVIYTTILKAQIYLSGLAGVGFMVVVGANILIAQTLAKRYGYRVYRDVIEFPGLERFSRSLGWVVWLGVLLFGYLLGQWGTTHWLDYLLARGALPLHTPDPLYGIDLGFYLFELPYLWFLFHLALVTVVACFLSALFLYLLEGGVRVTPRGPEIGSSARVHLAVLAALIFALLAYRLRLAQFDLLYSPRGALYGAGYADVHASLPMLRLLLVLCLLTAVAFLAGAARTSSPWRVSLRPAGIMVLALAAVGLLGGRVYPEIVQYLVVLPNEYEKERPYLKSEIEFTRQAFALDRFDEREFSAVEDLTAAEVKANQATLRNVRLWDHRPLLTTFAQIQEIRTYYKFGTVDNDRYWVNGTYRQVSLSPRELDTESLPNPSWVNKRLTYTHGYGLCLGPVNEYSSEGLPELFVKDIPPVSATSLRITRPEIYFGGLPRDPAQDYCLVKTHAQEFDYPAGARDVYTTYQGSGGIPVRTFWRRLLFALKFGEKNIVFRTDIDPESRLIVYRQVLERVHRLTPFLRYDHDPYMVIAQDGSLYWMIDGYTTSYRYPYSEPYPGVGNYIRNSVKATVNAYTGEVRFYISDPTDVMIQVYSRLFPGVFLPLSEMPKDLRAHIRYPEDFFLIQARMYSVFHMTDPKVFYSKEDLWIVAQSAVAGAAAPMSPYYTIMKLPEVGTTEEFILMVPFTPSQKTNMIGWMAARCDEPNYGKVLVFAFPKQKLVYGPQQIESRIDQDPTISQQLTLWGQGGSRVIRGTLLVIPVLNSVLYVEPLYLTAEAGGGLPQLKRVIAAYSDHVVMESSLEAAIGSIFGAILPSASPTALAATAPAPATATAPTLPGAWQEMVREANQHYERAQQLLRQGDWSGYGEEVKKLGEVLKRLGGQAQARPSR